MKGTYADVGRGLHGLAMPSAEAWAGRLQLKRVGREHVGPCPVCGGPDRFHVRGERIAARRRSGSGRARHGLKPLRNAYGIMTLTHYGGTAGPVTPPTPTKEPLFRWYKNCPTLAKSVPA